MDETRTRAIRERIRANFDRGACQYGKFESETSFFRDLLASLLALAPPLRGRRVLDVGCGTGASAEGLAEAVQPTGHVCGIDISLGMLREARTRLTHRAALALMDGCAFGRGFRVPFDAVVYNAVLFMLPDARASLESAREVLAPGGVVLVSYLEGAFLAGDDLPVPAYLAARGLPAGRHALSSWPGVLRALEDLFFNVQTRTLRLALSPERFLDFYGQEPMSAGLLPSLPFPERRRALEDVAGELRSRDQGVEQVWNLACARKPA